MSEINIPQALYSMPELHVVEHRRSVLQPVLLILVGAVLFVADSFVDMSNSTDSLKSALMLVASTLVFCGLIWGVVRLKGAGAPYCEPDGAFLQHKRLRFTKDKKTKIVDLVNSKDFSTLRSLEEDGVSAVVVEIYFSKKSKLCAAQVFEYSEMTFVPVTKVQVLK
jgi:hypothetical protein